MWHLLACDYTQATINAQGIERQRIALIEMDGKHPDGEDSNPNPCFDDLPLFDKVGIAKLNEVQKGHIDDAFNSKGIKTLDNLAYHGKRGEFEYWILIDTDETYYITRTQSLSCPHYYVGKKTDWKGCNYINPCENLWKRSKLKVGKSTGEEAADMIEYTFVGILGSMTALELGAVAATEVAATTFGETVAGQFIVQNGSQWLGATFAETWATCYECNEEEFATKFAEVLAVNMAGDAAMEGLLLGGKAAGKILYNKFKEKVVASNLDRFAEVKNWDNDLWEGFIKKVKEKTGTNVKPNLSNLEAAYALLRKNNIDLRYYDELKAASSSSCNFACAVSAFGCFTANTAISSREGQNTRKVPISRL